MRRVWFGRVGEVQILPGLGWCDCGFASDARLYGCGMGWLCALVNRMMKNDNAQLSGHGARGYHDPVFFD